MSKHVPLQVTSRDGTVSASTVWRQGSSVWATVIAKATFKLVHDGPAQRVEPVDLVTADRCRPTGSLEHASEVAPYLPSVGVVLSGQAYAPAGGSVSSTRVRLGVAGAAATRLLDKTLQVLGDRTSTVDRERRPFEKMPLLYERACGGPDNPVGVPPGSSAAPNVLDPADIQRPAGFGPIASHWPARRALLGELDTAALEAPVLELPARFDWRYFQAAPSDQRLDALSGGEWIVLDGMNSTLARVQSRLPDLAARAEWRVVNAAGAGPAHPIDLYADMLVIDADLLLCSLVWRGRFAVERLDALADIRVAVDVEPTNAGGARRTALAAHPSPSPTSAAPSALASMAGTSEVDVRAVMRRVLPFQPTGHELAGTLPLAEGPAHDPPGRRAPPMEPPVPDAEGQGQPAAQIAPPTGACTPVEALAGTLGLGEADPLRRTLPFKAPDPAHPPVASVPGPPHPRVAESLTGTAEISHDAVCYASLPFEATLASAPSVPSAPRAQRETQTRVEPTPSPVSSARPAGSPLVRASIRDLVLERLRAGRVLHGLDLVGADLSGLDLSGALMIGLDLRRANLRGAKLPRAHLVGAQLASADLTDAELGGADLSRADLTGAVLVRADLEGAALVDTNLTGADLRDAKVPRREPPPDDAASKPR